MKKYNIIVGLMITISSLIGFPTQLIAQPLEIIPIPDSIPEKIEYYADKYNVSSKVMTQVISCETANTFDPSIHSGVTYNFSSEKRGIKKGQKERSYGLSQIHLPDHPEVTYEQAIDADFALDFMASHLSKGKGNMWSCYRKIKGI